MNTKPEATSSAGPVAPPELPAAIADLFPLRVAILPNQFDPIIQIESPPRGPHATYVLAIFNARMPSVEQQALAEFLVDVANAAACRFASPPPEGEIETQRTAPPGAGRGGGA